MVLEDQLGIEWCMRTSQGRHGACGSIRDGVVLEGNAVQEAIGRGKKRLETLSCSRGFTHPAATLSHAMSYVYCTYP